MPVQLRKVRMAVAAAAVADAMSRTRSDLAAASRDFWVTAINCRAHSWSNSSGLAARDFAISAIAASEISAQAGCRIFVKVSGDVLK